ncbi:ADP-ribose pyrophosphatase [Marvinbryantia formatexigens]|nr:ADP-ribose pyrophosphatase [Marvinbryantia formatexigens]
MDRDNKILKIDKMTDNPFLNMYDVTARNCAGGIFHYYFASRGEGENLKCLTRENTPEGIMIYAILKEDPSKVVLVKQYRYPINDFVYEMPAGLADAGERMETTAVREFHEETGMTLELYEGGDPALRNAFYTTVGLTDESVSVLYGFAAGNPNGDSREATEDIEVVIADREEAKRILREEKVAMKCAQSLIHFLHADPEKPFAFLDMD